MSQTPNRRRVIPDITEAPPLDDTPPIPDDFDWIAELGGDQTEQVTSNENSRYRTASNLETGKSNQTTSRTHQLQAQTEEQHVNRDNTAQDNVSQSEDDDDQVIILPNKNNKRKKSASAKGTRNQNLFCDICQVKSSGPKDMETHLRGKRHKTKARTQSLHLRNKGIARHGEAASRITRDGDSPQQGRDVASSSVDTSPSIGTPSLQVDDISSVPFQPREKQILSNTGSRRLSAGKIVTQNEHQSVAKDTTSSASQAVQKNMHWREYSPKPKANRELRSDEIPTKLTGSKRSREDAGSQSREHQNRYDQAHASNDHNVRQPQDIRPAPTPKQYFERDPSIPTWGFGMKIDQESMKEDAPLVPREWLEETMTVQEWKELRESAFTFGSDIDKLAFKIMRELLLSPTCGIGFNWLKPTSNVLMEFGGDQHFNPHTGGFFRSDNIPPELRDPQKVKERDEDYVPGTGEEKQAALRTIADNIAYLFFPEDDVPAPDHGKQLDAGNMPIRGGIGDRSMNQTPGVYTGHYLESKFRDCVVQDDLFTQIFHHQLYEKRAAKENER